MPTKEEKGRREEGRDGRTKKKRRILKKNNNINNPETHKQQTTRNTKKEEREEERKKRKEEKKQYRGGPRFSALEIVPFLGLVPFSCNVRKRHYFKYNFEYNATAIRHQHSIQRFERGPKEEVNAIPLL